MTTHPLSPTQIVPVTRQKPMPAMSLLALCTLGLSLSASAQKPTITTFDAPGSVETIPNDINDGGAITGFYFDGNIFRGFLRSHDGTITTFVFPGADATVGASVNRAGTIAGFYSQGSVHGHGFVRSRDGHLTSFDPVGSISTEPVSINSKGRSWECTTTPIMCRMVLSGRRTARSRASILRARLQPSSQP